MIGSRQEGGACRCPGSGRPPRDTRTPPRLCARFRCGSRRPRRGHFKGGLKRRASCTMPLGRSVAAARLVAPAPPLRRGPPLLTRPSGGAYVASCPRPAGGRVHRGGLSRDATSIHHSWIDPGLVILLRRSSAKRSRSGRFTRGTAWRWAKRKRCGSKAGEAPSDRQSGRQVEYGGTPVVERRRGVGLGGPPDGERADRDPGIAWGRAHRVSTSGWCAARSGDASADAPSWWPSSARRPPV